MIGVDFFKKNNGGFTIMEILVAMTVFLIVLMAFLGLFISALREQKNSSDKVHLLNNGSYAIEYMTRAIRMAEKNIGLADDSCVADKKNYAQPYGDISLQFLKTEWDPTANGGVGDYIQKCYLFYLNNNKVVMKKSSNSTTSGFPVDPEDLTPADIIVSSLRFFVQDNTQANYFQPIVTIALEMQSVSSQTLQFQTSVSQRQLDIAY